MNHEVKGGKKPNKTNLLRGNTEVVGVLSGTEEIREGRLTIQCLKPKLFSFFFFLINSKHVCLIIKLWKTPDMKAGGCCNARAGLSTQSC